MKKRKKRRRKNQGSKNGREGNGRRGDIKKELDLVMNTGAK
jgi:hypothetical protein